MITLDKNWEWKVKEICMKFLQKKYSKLWCLKEKAGERKKEREEREVREKCERGRERRKVFTIGAALDGGGDEMIGG